MDLEKAYDRVPREVIYWSLQRKGVPEKLVRLIQETYRNTKMAVCTETNSSREFNISVGLHQGLALSPLLFAIIVDELTLALELRGEEMWKLLFADDLVEMNTKKRGLQKRLKEWQRCLEKGGLKVNVAKMETLVCKMGGGGVLKVRDINGEEIRQVKEFKYLGAMLCEGRGSSRDVQERVKAGWRK